MLTNKELYQLKWLLGLVLTGLSLWALCSLDFKSEVHLLVAFVILAFAFISPTRVAGIPSKVWRPLGAGVFVLIAVDFALHLPDFMPPLLRMVILLLIYRVLAPRARRDDLQLLLLGLFCLVISGVLTLSLLFALQILLFAPIAMGLLFLISWLDRGPESRSVVPELEGLKVLPLLRRVVRILNLKVLLLGGVMFAFVVAVSTLLFVLTPRFNLEQSLPFLQISGQARAGFSDEVGLGAVSEIISDDSVALRIDVPSKEAVIAAPYWRVLVLDEYQAGGFLMSSGLKEHPFRSFQQKRELMGATMAVESGQVLERKGALWTFYWEGGMSQYLPLPGAFHLLRFEGLQDIELISDLHVLGLDAVKQRVFSYQVEDLVFSERFPASASEKQAFVNPSEAPGVAYPWTTLKLGVSEAELERLQTMNRRITGGDSGLSALEYSEAARQYLSQNYKYSLRPDGASKSGDPVVSWLDAGTQGHCEFFAGSFVLLARAAGYPARMVVGFSGGSWNPIESYYVVRNRDAHAWAEIYDASMGEWLRVDPTPGSFVAGDVAAASERVPEMEADWAAWMDSLRIQWYRRIVNFDQADQIDMALGVKGFWGRVAEPIRERFRESFQEFKQWVTHPFTGMNWLPWAIVLFVMIAVWGTWRVRYSLRRLLARLLGRAAPMDPVRREASVYLHRLQKREVSGRVQDELKALRFGPTVETRLAAEVFKRAKAALRKRSE